MFIYPINEPTRHIHRVIADQNEPAVKAVLKLKLPNEVAGTPLKGASSATGASTGGVAVATVDPLNIIEAVAFGDRCHGEFLVSMDVRGVAVDPRSKSTVGKSEFAIFSQGH